MVEGMESKPAKIKRYAAQGDVLLIRVDEIPLGAARDDSPGANVIAHSETGHHHTATGCDIYREPGVSGVCYLYSESPIRVEHHRPWDTHAPVELEGGTWVAKRQREHTPRGLRWVAD